MKLIPVMSRSFAGKFALGSCLVVMCSSAARSVLLAEQRGPVQRTVQGKVIDGGNAVVNGAVVYLKDDRSLSVKSYITDADGTYRFGQLAQSTDYELWAESNGKKSAVKSISSFDSKNQFYIDLKIGK